MLAISFVYRYQAPSNVEQPKQHSNYQQQSIKPARVPYNAVNEGDPAYIYYNIIRMFLLK